MSKQLALWRSTDTPSTLATEYCSPMGNGSTFGTEAAQSMVVAAAGIFRNLRIVLSAAPGTGNSWTITLRVNGSGSALTLTFSNTDTDLEITGTDVSVSAGDRISLEFVPASGPTTMTPSVSLEFDSTTDGASIYGSGSQNVIVSGATRNTALFGGDTSANWLENFSVNAVEGDLTALYVSLDGDPVSGSYTFAIEKNSTLQDGSGGTVDTRVTISGGSTSGNATFSLSCTPGDLFRLRCTPATPGTARRPRYGVRLIADTPGVSNFPAASNDPLNASATEYFSGYGDSSGNWSGTESARQATAGVAFTLTHLRWNINASPGTPRSYALTLRVNGSNTGLTASIADAATSASVSATVAIVPGDLVSVSMVPTNTPAVRNAHWSFSQEIITARPRSWGAIF